MKLPGIEKAIVPRGKVVDYLLSETHRDGRHKAVFFRRFGYSIESWGQLAEDLLQHGRYDVLRAEDSAFGTRYVIEGIILTPDGRRPNIRTVWFIERGDDVPRLATAYPAG